MLVSIVVARRCNLSSAHFISELQNRYHRNVQTEEQLGHSTVNRSRYPKYTNLSIWMGVVPTRKEQKNHHEIKTAVAVALFENGTTSGTRIVILGLGEQFVGLPCVQR
jgi:hypothetical protein